MKWLLGLGSILMMFGAACGKREALTPANGLSGLPLPDAPIKLVLDSEPVLELGFAQTQELRLGVYYLDDRPAVDRPVLFEVQGEAGGSALDSSLLFSNSLGQVVNTLTSGSAITDFQISMTTPQADGSGPDPRVTLTVRVDGQPRGILRVGFSYPGPVSLYNIRTRVHSGTLDCDGIAWPTQPQGLVESVAANPQAILPFPNLLAGNVYSVSAVAHRANGDVAATGCAVAPELSPESQTNVVVPLTLGAIQLAGTYDFGAELQLQEALPGPAGGVVDVLDAFFQDPANVMAPFLVQGIAQATGWSETAVQTAIITAWTFYIVAQNYPSPDLDGDGMVIDDPLDWFIFNRAPAWVNESFTVGGDLTGLLTRFSVGGTLEISSVEESGSLAGRWDWHDFLFTWRQGQGCALDDMCCGRTEFSGQEMGLSPVGAQFTGQLVRHSSQQSIGYDLSIDEHRLDFQYGNLLVFALNYFVLPSLTGQPNVGCAVESMFGCSGEGTFVCDGASTGNCGCERVGNWLSSFLSGFLPEALPPALGAQACKMTLALATDYVEGLINGLAYDGTDGTYLLMAVEQGELRDENLSMRTDALEGELAGSLVYKHEANGFSGNIRGDKVRQVCTTSMECGDQGTCSAVPDILNTCDNRLVCTW